MAELYYDIENKAVVSRQELEREYMENDVMREEYESFKAYLYNALTRNGGTLVNRAQVAITLCRAVVNGQDALADEYRSALAEMDERSRE